MYKPTWPWGTTLNLIGQQDPFGLWMWLMTVPDLLHGIVQGIRRRQRLSAFALRSLPNPNFWPLHFQESTAGLQM